MARMKKHRQQQATGREGVIVSHFGVAVLVRYVDNGGNSCEERVKVKRNSGHVVGDRVLVSAQRLQRLPRRNVLRRRDPFAKERIIAANLDVLAIVVAPTPQTPAGFLERAVVAARAAGIEPSVVVNKSDLATADTLYHQLEEDLPAVERLLGVSAHTGGGIDQLRQFIATNGRVAFVGVSGAGKSSIMNALHPPAELETGSLNDDDHGCHTTSFSTLIALPDGGEVVDTPGFRDLAPVDVSSEDLAHWYPGLLSIIEEQPCRFRNCRHRQEPGCSVKQAVAQGRLSTQRYELYLATLDEIEAVEKSSAERGRV